VQEPLLDGGSPPTCFPSRSAWQSGRLQPARQLLVGSRAPSATRALMLPDPPGVTAIEQGLPAPPSFRSPFPSWQHPHRFLEEVIVAEIAGLQRQGTTGFVFANGQGRPRDFRADAQRADLQGAMTAGGFSAGDDELRTRPAAPQRQLGQACSMRWPAASPSCACTAATCPAPPSSRSRRAFSGLLLRPARCPRGTFRGGQLARVDAE
jgi:hypothetical protein